MSYKDTVPVSRNHLDRGATEEWRTEVTKIVTKRWLQLWSKSPGRHLVYLSHCRHDVFCGVPSVNNRFTSKLFSVGHFLWCFGSREALSVLVPVVCRSNWRGGTWGLQFCRREGWTPVSCPSVGLYYDWNRQLSPTSTSTGVDTLSILWESSPPVFQYVWGPRNGPFGMFVDIQS